MFNTVFYASAVTVIPIFFITLALELSSARSPLMRRMVALYYYRKLRRFESIRDRLQWFFRGLLILFTALLPIVTILGLAAELSGLYALDTRRDSGLIHSLVVVGVSALPTLTLFWAIAIREREPTPFEEELDRLADERDRVITELGAEVLALEDDAASGKSIDSRRAGRVRRRLAALNRQNRSLGRSTVKARRSLQRLRQLEDEPRANGARKREPRRSGVS